ncbi:MAG: type VI secretion system protein TssA [Desulfosalsimonas sp.]
MDISSLGKTPISADAPTGEDTTYLPEFEEIQNEIDKLSVVTAGAGRVDWNRVLELSSRLLSEKSKNLLVAAYMGEALIKTRQLEGFHQGTLVIKDMVENYWDTFFPPKKRKKGRINALKWWYDRAEKFLKNFEPEPVPQEQADAVKETLTKLDSLLAEKLDDAPVLRPLIQYADQIPVQPGEAEPAPQEPKQESKEASQQAEPEKAETGKNADTQEKQETASQHGDPEDTQQGQAPQEPRKSETKKPPDPVPAAPAMAGEPESDKDANKTLNAALDVMARLSRYYLKTNSANPIAYRLNRIYAWLTIDALPMVQEENKTPLPPPDPVVKSGLEKQLAGSDYENAVVSAEARLREHLFWLDLNRIAASGLESLGGKYAAAHEMVCRETALFVKGLPGLQDLAFSDGTPFCDSDTRVWLKSITAEDEPEDNTAGTNRTTDSNGQSRYEQIQEEAGRLVKNKKIFDAVHLFQENLAHCASGREKMLFCMGLSRMLLKAGKLEPALPHLELLESMIDSHGLEQWEPDLAARALELIYKGFKDCSRDHLKDRSAEVFDRMARISPAVAYKLSGA